MKPKKMNAVKKTPRKTKIALKYTARIENHGHKKVALIPDTTSELLWLRWLLKDLGVSTSSATPLYYDS